MISDESGDESDNSQAKQDQTKSHYKTFTYDFLIKLILKWAPESATEKIREMGYWGLNSNENVLMSLLINRQDAVVK